MVKHSEAQNTVRVIRDLPSKYGMKPAAGLAGAGPQDGPRVNAIRFGDGA